VSATSVDERGLQINAQGPSRSRLRFVRELLRRYFAPESVVSQPAGTDGTESEVMGVQVNGIAQGRAAGGLQRLLATRWRRNCPVGIALCTKARSFAGYVGTPCDGAVWLRRPRPGQSKISREAERAARAWGAGESASRGIKTVELSCIVTFGRESQTFAAHIQSKRMRQARYLPHPGHAKL
jgi:hypothetical protein